MSTKIMLSTGAVGRTPLANLRATRSNTKATMQQMNTSLQVTMLEKKKAKAKELEQEAHKLLTGEDCLSDETVITHHTILQTLSQLIQKYSVTAPQSLKRALTALVVLLQ